METTLPPLEELIAGRLPDARGRYGPFGGRYVPETLVGAVERLELCAREALADDEFTRRLAAELANWVGRPTPLTRADGLGWRWGAEIWLKREDLTHTGAHKINNAIGQALLARRMGAERVVAETGAGQHGVATAAACARVGLPCVVYMGSVDVRRQAPTSCGCGISAPRFARSTPATARCARRSTRRFATGCRTRRRPTTCSAPPSARIPIRGLYVRFRA